MRRTKLVCTIGPASRERVPELVAAGLDIARLNYSHGSAAEHARAAAEIRASARSAGRTVAILADLPGPKIRLTGVPDGTRDLGQGDEVVLTPRPTGDEIGITYAGLANDVRVGDALLLADGSIELRVTGTDEGSVRAEVVRGGSVASGAGLNAPSERLAIPAITPEDRAALPAARTIGADYVAQSFVRRAEDVRSLRELMGPESIPIMAKIETRSAVDNLPEILAEADAVMLARGDLGVEIPFAEVPLVQKRVIDACVAAGVPVVVATQMLESMVGSARPTRAEASDVANAVLDGADAIMLSAETAIGDYPVEAARAAVVICLAAESDPSQMHRPSEPLALGGPSAAIAAAAVELSERKGDPVIRGIACFTRTGRTANLLAMLRPRCAILALSPDAATVRRMALLRAVVPVEAQEPEDTERMVALLERSLLASGLAQGDHVVLVGSIPFGQASTNLLKLHRLGA